MSNHIHEYLDANGVRTRYIYVQDSDSFDRIKETYIMKDETTKILRKIEDREDDIAYMKRWRVGSVLLLLFSLAGIIIGVMGGAEGLIGLWLFFGILGAIGGSVTTLFTSSDIRESVIKLRNHRRELEDLMIESV